MGIDDPGAIADDRRMIATPAQIKAARALLGWSTADLAERMDVARNTVTRLEDPEQNPTAKSLRRATEILASAGVIFIARDPFGGDGVRLAEPRATNISVEPSAS